MEDGDLMVDADSMKNGDDRGDRRQGGRDVAG
jgi:hypothetical protein